MENIDLNINDELILKYNNKIYKLLIEVNNYYDSVYENFFFEEDDHFSRWYGSIYYCFEAIMDEKLVEDITYFGEELEGLIGELNSNKITRKFFGLVSYENCEYLQELFEVDSPLEEFSRFNFEEKKQELFEEYAMYGSNIDWYDQQAQESATVIAEELGEIYKEDVLEGLHALHQVRVFLRALLVGE